MFRKLSTSLKMQQKSKFEQLGQKSEGHRRSYVAGYFRSTRHGWKTSRSGRRSLRRVSHSVARKSSTENRIDDEKKAQSNVWGKGFELEQGSKSRRWAEVFFISFQKMRDALTPSVWKQLRSTYTYRQFRISLRQK